MAYDMHMNSNTTMPPMPPMMMMMQMSFYASNHVTLFFDGWKTTNGWEMFGSCLAMIILGIFYEGFKRFRKYLKVKSITNPNSATYGSLGNENQDLLRYKAKRKTLSHIIAAFLQVLQVFIGYLLMLAFMTYNAWICISVLIGAGLGYLAFAGEDENSESFGDHCNM